MTNKEIPVEPDEILAALIPGSTDGITENQRACINALGSCGCLILVFIIVAGASYTIMACCG